MRKESLEQLNACRSAHRPCVLFRNLDTHESFVLEPGLHVDEQEMDLRELAMQALTTDRCVRREVRGTGLVHPAVQCAVAPDHRRRGAYRPIPGKLCAVLRL